MGIRATVHHRDPTARQPHVSTVRRRRRSIARQLPVDRGMVATTAAIAAATGGAVTGRPRLA